MPDLKYFPPPGVKGVVKASMDIYSNQIEINVKKFRFISKVFILRFQLNPIPYVYPACPVGQMIVLGCNFRLQAEAFTVIKQWAYSTGRLSPLALGLELSRLRRNFFDRINTINKIFFIS